MMNARINSFKIFREIANEIYNKIDKINTIKSFDYIIAFTVNCSLSCELGLKAILADSFNFVKEHNLKKLFFSLKNYQQQFIKDHMPSLKDKSVNSLEFNELIDEVSNNFVDWRYFYEKDVKTNWLFLYELMNAINESFDQGS